jgi:hypothetical protein
MPAESGFDKFGYAGRLELLKTGFPGTFQRTNATGYV